MSMIKAYYTKKEDQDKKALYYNIHYCNSVIEYMKEYVKEKRKSIKHINQNTRDYILMDIAHELGKKVDIEIPINTQTLYEKHNYCNYIEPKELMYIVKIIYVPYVDHVLEQKDFLKQKHISIADSLFVLSDFLNYTYEKKEEKDIINKQNENKIYGKTKRS